MFLKTIIFESNNEDGYSEGKELNERSEKHVSFQFVEIREYEQVPCDNPSCHLGPAIGLGWNYTSVKKINFIDFENNREPSRPQKKLYLPRAKRLEIMKLSSFSRKELKVLTLSRTRVISQRAQTMQNLHLAPYEEKLENAFRKLKRIVLRREKDAELLKLWPEYKITPKKRPSITSFQTADTLSSQNIMSSF